MLLNIILSILLFLAVMIVAQWNAFKVQFFLHELNN